jgi:hypothetical protein
VLQGEPAGWSVGPPVPSGGAGCRADPGLERFDRDVRPFRIRESTARVRQEESARSTVRDAGR